MPEHCVTNHVQMVHEQAHLGEAFSEISIPLQHSKRDARGQGVGHVRPFVGIRKDRSDDDKALLFINTITNKSFRRVRILLQKQICSKLRKTYNMNPPSPPVTASR
jgi:hypothetical protein